MARRGLGRTFAGVVAVAAVCTVSTDVWTANELKKRTPPAWLGYGCMQIVDRSADPVVHVNYTVANDDPDPAKDEQRGEDELEDSRTHQFFALGKQEFDMWGENASDSPLPVWINDGDIQRVVDKEAETKVPPNAPKLDSPDDVPDEEVLERSPIWPGDTWTRITGDDDRRAIALDVANAGFDWDTSTVDAGTWLIAGYVFEPRGNIWNIRPEALKVVDDPNDRAATGPAAFLPPKENVAMPGETVVVEACIDAMAGSKVTLFVGELPGGAQEPDWVEAVSVDVENGEVELEAATPECAHHSSATSDRTLLKFKLVVEDPEGRTYTAYSPQLTSLLDAPICEDTGCSCRAGGELRWSWLTALCVPLARRRRRR